MQCVVTSGCGGRERKILRWCPAPLGGRSGNRSRYSRPTSNMPALLTSRLRTARGTMTGVSADADVLQPRRTLLPLPPLSEPCAASPVHSASSDPQLQGSVFAFVWFDSRIGGILWSLHLCSCGNCAALCCSLEFGPMILTPIGCL